MVRHTATIVTWWNRANWPRSNRNHWSKSSNANRVIQVDHWLSLRTAVLILHLHSSWNHFTTRERFEQDRKQCLPHLWSCWCPIARGRMGLHIAKRQTNRLSQWVRHWVGRLNRRLLSSSWRRSHLDVGSRWTERSCSHLLASNSVPATQRSRHLHLCCQQQSRQSREILLGLCWK